MAIEKFTGIGKKSISEPARGVLVTGNTSRTSNFFFSDTWRLIPTLDSSNNKDLIRVPSGLKCEFFINKFEFKNIQLLSESSQTLELECTLKNGVTELFKFERNNWPWIDWSDCSPADDVNVIKNKGEFSAFASGVSGTDNLTMREGIVNKPTSFAGCGNESGRVYCMWYFPEMLQSQAGLIQDVALGNFKIILPNSSRIAFEDKKIEPFLDGYVQGGVFSNNSLQYYYGNKLLARDRNSDFKREIFLSFDLKGLNGVKDAILKIFSAGDTSTNFELELWKVANTLTPSTTWDTKPTEETKLDDIDLNGTSFNEEIEINLTSLFNTAIFNDEKTVTLKIKNTSFSNTAFKAFSTRETDKNLIPSLTLKNFMLK